MLKSKRTLLSALALVTILALCLSACGQNSSNSSNTQASVATGATTAEISPTASDSGDSTVTSPAASTDTENSPATTADASIPQTDITITVGAQAQTTDAGKQFQDQTAENFKELTGITVQWVTADTSNYPTWLQTQLMGGTAPDAFWSNMINWPQQFMRDGLIVDLTPYLNQENIFNPGGGTWLSQLSPAIVSEISDQSNGNKIVAIPRSVGANKLAYNKDIFEKVGISSPPATWAEMMDDCAKLQTAGYVPFGYAGKDGASGNLHWILSMVCASLTSSTWPQLDVNNSGMIETNETVKGVEDGTIDITKSPWIDIFPLVKDFSQYWLPGWETLDNTDLMNKFAAGNFAMMQMGVWMAQTVYTNPDRTFDIGIVPMPAITTETSPYGAGISYSLGGVSYDLWSLNASAPQENQNAALKFLQYINSPQFAESLIADTWQVPPLKTLPSVPDNPISQFSMDYNVEKMDLFNTSYDQQFLADAVSYGQLYIEGKMSAADYAAKLQQDLVDATQNYMQSNDWSESNNYGLDATPTP